MSKILVEKPSEETLKKLNVKTWGIWQKEASEFPWHYDEKETCYILEGRVKVTPKDGEPVEFAAGDLVVFPEGMDCVWQVIEPVRKHYKFG